MGMLDRFTSIIKANINQLLDGAEDPAKMVDEYIIEIGESLEEVKQETASVMAEEKRAKRLVEENEAEVARFDKLARAALQAGNEGDARVFLSKKQQLQTKGAELAKAAEAAHENSVKMRAMHDKLVADLDELKQRRETIKAKVAVANTQSMVTGYTAGNQKAENAIAAFDRMEAKADRMLDTSAAMAELSEEPVDEVADLEKKYASATTNAAVDLELERMKEEMGL